VLEYPARPKKRNLVENELELLASPYPIKHKDAKMQYKFS
jgi:hypothetical protein